MRVVAVSYTHLDVDKRQVLIDPGSGYRYYSAAQLVDAEVIRRLRELDVPIPEVRRVLTARDERVTRQVVREHEERMQQRLREAEATIADLQRIAGAPLALLADRVQLRTCLLYTSRCV